jgi:hypothetical protein
MSEENVEARPPLDLAIPDPRYWRDTGGWGREKENS